MEVLIVSHKYPPAIGGMEKQSFELVNGMKKYVKVQTIVYTGESLRLLFFLTLNKKIKRLCKQHPDIQVIHFTDGLIAAFGIFYKASRHIKRTVTLHGLDVVFPNLIFRRFILSKFNRFSMVIAVSKATAKACIDLGISSGKVVVITNGVDPAIASLAQKNICTREMLTRPFDISADKRVLVMMGRPVKRKGFSWLLKNVIPFLDGNFVLLIVGPLASKPSATERLLRLLPAILSRQIELLLGYPTDQKAVRDLITRPQFANKVFHLGKLPFEKIIGILSIADGFIMPNIPYEGDMEGFGLVCLEAALCGATVFASDIDGIPDAIHHKKNGILLPPAVSSEWINMLNNVVTSVAGYGLNRDDVIQYTLDNFSWDKMVRSYYEHFTGLVAG